MGLEPAGTSLYEMGPTQPLFLWQKESFESCSHHVHFFEGAYSPQKCAL